MPGITVIAGNRLETLVRELAAHIRRPLPSAFDRETIMVQSAGMAHWLSLRLARLNGILGNTYFPFPNAFFDDLCSALLPDFDPLPHFDPDVMAFRIWRLLSESPPSSMSTALRAYSGPDAPPLKRFQLAAQIADLFDQYMVFRPDILARWEAGEPQKSRQAAWQADIWRQLATAGLPAHRARRLDHLIAKIHAGEVDGRHMPQRVSVFGMAHLPLFHLKVLTAISRYADVVFYFMNPCREYWADIVAEPEAGRIRRRYAPQAVAEADLHLDTGNCLLASMGALGRDFLSTLMSLECRYIERFTPLSPDRLLKAIQGDILNLVEAGRSGDGTRLASSPCGHSADTPATVDRSFQVHVCHSPLREVEVLYDHLLAMFDADPELKPKDILVMTPDIQRYAPIIQAVFDTPYDRRTAIPFSVADKHLMQDSPVTQAFFTILDLAASRLTATAVLALLECAVIRDRFALRETDLVLVEHWVRALNIRWGYDDDSRRRLGLPGYAENTWRAGIDRLLLGICMPGEERHFFEGILPYDDIEGAQTEILGRFLAFFDSLVEILESLEGSRPLNEWLRRLNDLLTRMFSGHEAYLSMLGPLRQQLNRLAAIDALTADPQPLDLATIRYHIQNRMRRRSYGTGFLTGGVTFCAMLPMRSIPFKVICLIGMNMEGFPRKDIHHPFDLMAAAPRPGDRSRRREDRYLFLESVVSARDRLYISYVGRDERDNSAKTPSVLVSELLEYAAKRAAKPPGAFVTEHRLQGFARAYYRPDGPLFSYSTENFEAAKAFGRRRSSAAFLDSTIALPAMDSASIDVAALTRFFEHPSASFLKERLSLRFEEDQRPFEESERFRLQGLDRYQAEQMLFQTLLQERPLADQLPVLKAKGMLPHGPVGHLTFRQMVMDIERYREHIEAAGLYQRTADMPLRLNLAGKTVTGRLKDVWQGRILRYRYAAKKPSALMAWWLHHLLLGATAETPSAADSYLVCKDITLCLEPVSDAESNLIDLLAFYQEGMRKPLRFFPATSYRFAEQVVVKGKSRSEALRSAQSAWWGNAYVPGESQDPYMALCFSGQDPLDARFEQLSIRIWRPFLVHCRSHKTGKTGITC